MKIYYTGLGFLPWWLDALKDQVFTLHNVIPSKIFTIHHPRQYFIPIYVRKDVVSFSLPNIKLAKKIVFGILPVLNQKNYSHFHVFGSDPRIIDGITVSASMKKFVTFVDGGLEEKKDFGASVNTINDTFDAVFVQTLRQKKLISKYINTKIYQIPFGVDLNYFKPIPNSNNNKKFKILFASIPNEANKYENRGLFILLSAMNEIDDNFQLTLLCREYGYDRIKNIVKNISIKPKNIKIIFGKQDMPNLINSHDASIIPYVSNVGVMDLPHSAIESLACGKPLITTNVIGLSDYIRCNNCGITIEPTTDGIINSFNKLYANYDYYKSNCRITAEKFFNREKFLENYIKTYINH